MKTPRQTSPYALIQESLRDDPWRLLVACIMLNQTSGKQVKQVLPTFFERWPDAASLQAALPLDVLEVIRPLGLYERRTKAIFRMTQDMLDGNPVDDFYGVGRYALDSYRMFVDPGEIVMDVQDKELKNYVKWATERSDDAILALSPYDRGYAHAVDGRPPEQDGKEYMDGYTMVRVHAPIKEANRRAHEELKKMLEGPSAKVVK